MRSRPITSALVSLCLGLPLASTACSGDDEKTASELAVEANAQVLCERLFNCCTPAELDALPFVDDQEPPTEEGCVAYHTKTALGFLPVTEGAFSAGRAAAHVDESAACVEQIRGESCSEFHKRLPRLHLGDAFSLCNAAIVEPLVEDGEPCTLYIDCRGGFCKTASGGAADGSAGAEGICESLPEEGERCVADGCAPGFRCDYDASTCRRYLDLGEDCVSDNTCASGACRDGHCASPGLCGG